MAKQACPGKSSASTKGTVRRRQGAKGVAYGNDDPIPVNDAPPSLPEPHLEHQAWRNGVSALVGRTFCPSMTSGYGVDVRKRTARDACPSRMNWRPSGPSGHRIGLRRHCTFGERLILTPQRNGERGVPVQKTRPASPVDAGASRLAGAGRTTLKRLNPSCRNRRTGLQPCRASGKFPPFVRDLSGYNNHFREFDLRKPLIINGAPSRS
jgi:hypothetical protein